MEIASFSLSHLKIPFLFTFSHSLSNRNETNSLICILRSQRGIIGYGEGAPRVYVTGETLESSKVAAMSLGKKVVGLKAGSFEDLLEDLKYLRKNRIAAKNPAAYCAVETALLDLFAREQGIPVWKLFVEKPRCKAMKYSGVLPLLPHSKFIQLCYFARALGLSRIKVKSNALHDAIDRLKLTRSILGPQIEILVDFNGALEVKECLAFMDRAVPFNISAIEQPLPKTDLEGLKYLTSMRRIPVIADESIYSEQDPSYLLDKGVCNGLNIRISSCGGILRTLELLRKCQQRKMISHLGAQVGETAILSAAARSTATIFGAPNFMEGSASRYLLSEDISQIDISFGQGGIAPALNEPGLGIDINFQALTRWSHPFFELP